MARWYAKEHLKTDPGVVAVYYLPKNAGDREIRFIEVNELISDRTDDAVVPIDFGVDMGTDDAHRLFVVDVTPKQWKRIKSKKLRLPKDWSIEGAIEFAK